MDVAKREDGALDELFVLYRGRDDAIRMLGKIILANPALDQALTAVVMRLANKTDSLVPVAYDAFAAPLYPHQLQE